MKIDLKSIIENQGESIPFDVSLDLSSISIYGEFPFTEPVRMSGFVINHTGILELNANINSKMTLHCSRCAKELYVEKNFPVFHVLSNSDDSECDDTFLMDGTQIDLQEVAVSAVMLNAERINLCKPDCKGLCQICGKDLNEGDCSCATRRIDPRMAPLQKLLDNWDK